MTFKAVLLAAALMLPATMALGQEAPADLKAYMSSAEIQALIAKAKAMPRVPLISQPFLGSGPYRAVLEYRTTVGPASIHDNDVELLMVVEGAGTMVTGGTLVDAKRSNPDNQSGRTISGGTPRHLTKGDFLIVPAGLAHQTTPDAGSVIVMIAFHAPGVWPGK